MIKNRIDGFTLIEVILSMAIISILLITYIVAFGQSTIIVSKGRNITNDTFDYQGTMENKIIEGKRNFIEKNEKGDYNIEIFTNNEKYKTSVDVKEIKTDIKGSRQYIAYVTNYQIEEPKSPKMDQFSVGVYNSSGEEVFPWYDDCNDNIIIKAKYRLSNEPPIFENRIRWYRSKEEIKKPVFSSGYDVIYEEIQKEPRPIDYEKTLTKVNGLLPNRFYYFESRPYTLAGRLNNFKNEERILILKRAGSKYWQNYMEDIYFKNRDNIKVFDRNNEEIYVDIMQNPNRPTLNLDWSNNSNPEGALIGMKIPETFSSSNFQTKVDFKLNPMGLEQDSKLGIGVALVNGNNSGIMIDLDATKNSIYINQIENGIYKKNIGNINILKSKEFQNLMYNGQFDWSKEYNFILQYFIDGKIKFKLEYEDSSSDFIEIDIKEYIILPTYIGLKSYSSMDYKPDTRYEIYNKYDRNYSSYFYDMDFEEIKEESKLPKDEHETIDNDIFYQGNSSINIANGSASSEKRINLNRKDMKVTGGQGSTITAKSFIVSENMLIQNNAKLTAEVEEYIIFKKNLVIEENKEPFLKIKAKDGKYPVYVYLKKGVFDKLNISNGNYTIEEFNEENVDWVEIKIENETTIKRKN